MKKRVRLHVSGQVQGVCFRAHTRDLALRLNVVGYVRNLPNGRVEVVAEGEDGALHDLVQFCHRGPPLARVTDVNVRWEESSEEFTDFSVR